jgi:hypothetical protein
VVQLDRGSVTVKRCILVLEISRHTPLPCPLYEAPKTGSLSKKIYIVIFLFCFQILIIFFSHYILII